MICNDCFYWTICQEYQGEFTEEEYKELGLNCFKDKSRFIELPCNIGDTIYCIYQYDDCFGNKDKPEIIKSTVRGFVFEEEKIKFVPSNYSEKSEFWYKLLDVFLSKEEAEKALKEYEKND